MLSAASACAARRADAARPRCGACPRGSWLVDRLLRHAAAVRRTGESGDHAHQLHAGGNTRIRSSVSNADMPTGAQVIVEQLEDAGVEVCSGCPACTISRSGRRSRAAIRLVACATSRPPRTRRTVTPAPGRARRRLDDHRARRREHPRRGRRGVGSRSPILVIATDIPSTLRRDGVTAACCTRPAARRRCSRR